MFKCGYYLWLDKGKGHDLDTDDYAIARNDFLCANNLLGQLQTYPIEKLRQPAVNKVTSKLAAIEKEVGSKISEDKEKIVERVMGASKAAGGIFRWILATLECYEIFKKVKPLKDEAREMELKLQRAEDDLAKTKAKVKELQDKVAVLK